MSDCECTTEQCSIEQSLAATVRAARVAIPKRQYRREREGGFTLLELLVVLAIIGLLGALIGPRLFERLEDSKTVTAQTQVRMLKTALDTMRLDIGRYPTGEEGLKLLIEAPSDPVLRLRWRGPYLEGAVPLDPWGKPYQYSPTGHDLNAITLYSYGPTGKPGGEMVGFLPAT